MLKIFRSRPERRTAGVRSGMRLLHLEALEPRLALAAIPAPSGLVAWWTGDGTAADSTGSNNGILEGGATYAAGVVGQAFSLDGIDDRIRVPNSAALNPTAGFTIEAWIRSNSTSGARNIISKWNDNTGDWSYIFKDHNDGDKLRIELRDAGIGVADLAGGTSIQIGQWTHVAMTFDANVVRLYFNGVPDGSQTVSPQRFIHASTADLLIGAVFAGGGVTENFNGLIDEVSLYDRALGGAEIQSIFAAGSDGKVKTLTMAVIGSNPAAGTAVDRPLTDFSINMSLPYDLSTIQPGDLTVNGRAADSFVATDSDTITFHYSTSPVTAIGSQTMAIAAGAITTGLVGVAGPSVEGWSATFNAQLPKLVVTSSQPAAGGTVTTTPTDYRVDFSSAYNLASVQASDLIVNGKPADSFVALDADTISFHFNASPVSSVGLQAMGIAAGAITAGTGVLTADVPAWSGTFRYLLPEANGPAGWWTGDGNAED